MIPAENREGKSQRGKLSAGFLRFTGEEHLFEKGDTVLVSCSGGVDSTVLLHLLYEHREELGITLSVVHFNHGLRGAEAERDAEFVRASAEKQGLRFILRRLDVSGEVKGSKVSIQDAGHRLRRAVYDELACDEGFTKVATAHHLDDQLETMLLHFIRGAGLRGMTGIRVVNGYLVRPLLFAERGEIEDYAESQGLKWVEDSSNDEDYYLRNRLRHGVVPLLRELNPSISEGAMRSSVVFTRISDGLSEFAEKIYDEALIEGSASEIILAIPRLKDYLNMLGHFVLDRALRELDEEPPSVSFRQFEQVLRMLENGATGDEVTFGEGYTALRDRERMVIYRLDREIETVSVVLGGRARFGGIELLTKVTDWTPDSHPPAGGANEVIDHSRVAGKELHLRSWKKGDRIRPLGLDGTKKVSDVLTEAKVPRNRKRGFPVLECDGELVWVCGLRLSESFKITEKTSKAVEMEIQTLSERRN